MKKYRVAFYWHTDCRAEEFVNARNQTVAFILATQKKEVYDDWVEGDEGFYVIVERVF